MVKQIPFHIIKLSSARIRQLFVFAIVIEHLADVVSSCQNCGFKLFWLNFSSILQSTNVLLLFYISPPYPYAKFFVSLFFLQHIITDITMFRHMLTARHCALSHHIHTIKNSRSIHHTHTTPSKSSENSLSICDSTFTYLQFTLGQPKNQKNMLNFTQSNLTQLRTKG